MGAHEGGLHGSAEQEHDDAHAEGGAVGHAEYGGTGEGVAEGGLQQESGGGEGGSAEGGGEGGGEPSFEDDVGPGGVRGFAAKKDADDFWCGYGDCAREEVEHYEWKEQQGCEGG